MALGLLQVLPPDHCNPQSPRDPCAISLLSPALLSLVVQGIGLNWLLITPRVTNLILAPKLVLFSQLKYLGLQSGRRKVLQVSVTHSSRV